MEEATKKRKRKEKPPPKPKGEFVVFLTHRRKIGQPLYLVPDSDSRRTARWQKTSKARYAMRFTTEAKAAKYAKLCNIEDYLCTVGTLPEEEPKAKPKAPGPRQTELPFGG